MMFSEDKKESHETCVNSQVVLNRPRSATSRFIHGFSCVMGGLCFIPASCLLFTSILYQYEFAATTSGWLFSIGSLCLLLADLQEWWYFRIGHICNCKYRHVQESEYEDFCKNEQKTKFQSEVKIEINLFVSICGSACYLFGSILFIPGFEKYLLVAQLLIMLGSLLIFLSEIAKLYRLGSTDLMNRHNYRFYFSNLFSALGAASFFIGTILFFPYFNTNDATSNRASAVYLCGGFGFFLSSLFILYDHFYFQNVSNDL